MHQFNKVLTFGWDQKMADIFFTSIPVNKIKFSERNNNAVHKMMMAHPQCKTKNKMKANER